MAATGQLGKEAAQMLLQKLLLHHLNKLKQLTESWLSGNHKNPANWLLHWGETQYPTGSLIFLLKLESSILCWFLFCRWKMLA